MQAVNKPLKDEPARAKGSRRSRRNLLKGVTGVGLTAGALAVTGGMAQLTLAQQSANNRVAVMNTGAGQQHVTSGLHITSAAGQLREYWVQVDSFYHTLVPTGVDGMMGMKINASQCSFWALGYRAYTPGWQKLLPGNDDIGPNMGMPGPVFRGKVGDTIRVHFRNNDTHYKAPHSIHPHGVLYTPENDGAWVAAFGNKPGTVVRLGESYTYEWTVLPSSVGTWPYHDHSIPMSIKGGIADMSSMAGMSNGELGAELGLFGMFALIDDKTPQVDKEIILCYHDLYQDDVPSLSQDYDCFNGYSYLGNTPTFHVKKGQRIRWRVMALGKEFHVFHLHGHRWLFNGRYDDSMVFGPAVTLTFDYIEDNPGTWLYHCHVTDHMMGGMMGLYVSEA